MLPLSPMRRVDVDLKVRRERIASTPRTTIANDHGATYSVPATNDNGERAQRRGASETLRRDDVPVAAC